MRATSSLLCNNVGQQSLVLEALQVLPPQLMRRLLICVVGHWVQLKAIGSAWAYTVTVVMVLPKV